MAIDAILKLATAALGLGLLACKIRSEWLRGDKLITDQEQGS